MSYAEAKAKYATIGVDTDTAIAKLKNVPVSLHCWQGDDVRGFDIKDIDLQRLTMFIDRQAKLILPFQRILRRS